MKNIPLTILISVIIFVVGNIIIFEYQHKRKKKLKDGEYCKQYCGSNNNNEQTE